MAELRPRYTQQWLVVRKDGTNFNAASVHSYMSDRDRMARELAKDFGMNLKTTNGNQPPIVSIDLNIPENVLLDPTTMQPLFDKEAAMSAPEYGAGTASNTKVAPEKPKMESTQNAFLSAGGEALKNAAARQTNKALTHLVLDETGLSTKYPQLSDERVRAAASLAISMFIHTAATNLPLPKAEFVAGGAKRCMQAGMQDGLDEVMDDVVAMLLPMWPKVVALLEKQAAMTQLPAASESEEDIKRRAAIAAAEAKLRQTL